MRTISRSSLVLLGLLAVSANDARADIALEQYEFQGQPGTETSVSPSTVATGLTGANFTEANVTANAGSNSINSAGWNTSGANYAFGFTVQSGEVATVDSITLATRSSATGPGTINVLASIDGGSYSAVASIVQPSATYVDTTVSFSTLTAYASVSFEFVAANQTAAGGGSIGASGTFRVGDYSPSGTPSPFTINGTIAPLSPSSVPVPASVILLGSGLSSMMALVRRRRLQVA